MARPGFRVGNAEPNAGNMMSSAYRLIDAVDRRATQ